MFQGLELLRLFLSLKIATIIQQPYVPSPIQDMNSVIGEKVLKWSPFHPNTPLF